MHEWETLFYFFLTTDMYVLLLLLSLFLSFTPQSTGMLTCPHSNYYFSYYNNISIITCSNIIGLRLSMTWKIMEIKGLARMDDTLWDLHNLSDHTEVKLFYYSIKIIPANSTGCKESQFYSLPFGQAVASIYQPTSHFN